MAYMDVAPAGAPNGESVLLLHGKNFSGAYWQATAARLGALGRRVVMPDQIGFGKSSKPTTMQYSFDLLAQSTAQLLDHLGVAEVVVVGHSMGGMLAVRFATAYEDRSTQLVLVNPIGLEDYRRVVPYLGVDAWTAQASKQTPDMIREYMRQNYFHGDWRPAYEPLLDIQAGWAVGPDAAVLARVSALTQDMLYTQPVSFDLPNIKAPTLLVIGQLDRTAPGKGDVTPHEARALGNYPELGERAARAIPRSKLVKLDQVGHVPQFESFELWMKALEAFLESGSGRPASNPAPAPR
jgi:pimeloyl-ACP methyl ester carboxylesterase